MEPFLPFSLDMNSPPAYGTDAAFVDMNSILEDGTTFMDLTSILEDGTNFMDLSPPPAYGTDASYRTTDQIYGWIRGDLPTDAVLPPPTHQPLRRAVCMKPLWSANALRKAFCPRLCDNWFGLTECTRATGLATLPFMVIGDIFVNVPFQLIRATRIIGEDAFELWRAKQMATIHMMDQIQDGLAIRLEATLKVIRDLGLETPGILDGKTQGDEILDTLLSQKNDEDGVILCTVTLLVTALASRFSPEGTICLASGNILPRIYCPPLFLEFFDLIHCLKVNPILINISPQQLGAVPTLEYCLRKLVPALKADAIEANDMPPQLQQLLPTLRDMKFAISCVQEFFVIVTSRLRRKLEFDWCSLTLFRRRNSILERLGKYLAIGVEGGSKFGGQQNQLVQIGQQSIKLL